MTRLYIYMGFPCTGKTTHAKMSHIPLIEVDEVRKTLTGTYEATDHNSTLVADVVYQSVHHYLSRGLDVAVEGIFLTESSRRLFVDLAKNCEAEVDVHWFDPNFEWIRTQLINQKEQKRNISLATIIQLSKKFEFPTVDEGFDKLFYYCEKDFSKKSESTI